MEKRNHLFIRGTLILLTVVAVGAGCRRETTPKLEVKTQATETTPEGSRVTKTESTEIGSTLVKETQTTSRGSLGPGKSDVHTYVGTVTSLTTGHTIEVLTGDNDHHRVDLDGKDTTVDLDPSVAVGNRVKLVEARDDRGHRTVSVSPVR